MSHSNEVEMQAQCIWCLTETSELSGDPSLWPVYFPEDHGGFNVAHCMSCILKRVNFCAECFNETLSSERDLKSLILSRDSQAVEIQHLRAQLAEARADANSTAQILKAAERDYLARIEFLKAQLTEAESKRDEWKRLYNAQAEHHAVVEAKFEAALAEARTEAEKYRQLGMGVAEKLAETKAALAKVEAENERLKKRRTIPQTLKR